ncbi:hypothetical protein, partial [Leifsonia xyli]|uniref:hypothetical protein n=1 Tax=Leifsonia xyli TaxID=1575 RepID=UPI00210DCE9B
MNRELWQRQLDAGAWGITLATPWQVSVALGWGILRVSRRSGRVGHDHRRPLPRRLRRDLLRREGGHRDR